MNDNDVLCVIRWCIDDVAVAFERIHGRKATDKELDTCLENLNTKLLEVVCIERGWDIINLACE